MTHKERIAWILAFQKVFKRSKERVAPVLPASKKQAEFSEKEASEARPAIIRRSMSIVDQAEGSKAKQTTIRYRNDNVRMQNFYNNTAKLIFSKLMPLTKERQVSPKTELPTAKLDHRLLLKHIVARALKQRQVHSEHLTSTSPLLSAETLGSASLGKKSFAPEQARPVVQSSQKNGSRKITSAVIHQHVESSFNRQSRDLDEPDLDGALPKTLNDERPSLDEEATIEQKQTGSSPKAFASTLHLDGTSLGRWAVQHLERVLSKPSSGITGIDPRATIPRSQVAPF